MQFKRWLSLTLQLQPGPHSLHTVSCVYTQLLPVMTFSQTSGSQACDANKQQPNDKTRNCCVELEHDGLINCSCNLVTAKKYQSLTGNS